MAICQEKTQLNNYSLGLDTDDRLIEVVNSFRAIARTNFIKGE